VFICIHKLKPSLDGSGSDGTWEVVMRQKRKRHRSPSWDIEEIIAYVKLREEGLGVVEVKDHWDGIALQCNIMGRGSRACEDQWGTLLKRHRDIQKDLHSKNVNPDNTSEWVSYWKMVGNEKSKNKLLKGFSLECYEMMERILGMKPRRKVGSNKKQMMDATAPSSIASQGESKDIGGPEDHQSDHIHGDNGSAQLSRQGTVYEDELEGIHLQTMATCCCGAQCTCRTSNAKLKATIIDLIVENVHLRRQLGYYNPAPGITIHMCSTFSFHA
jgi:hypothetical protein